MKIRKGFVSNSSSSSFILSISKDIGDSDDLIIRVPASYIKSQCRIIESVEELQKWFVDNYGWNDQTFEQTLEEEDWFETEYEECVKELESGKVILKADIDYSVSESFSNFVSNCENIKVIRNEN